MATIDDLAALCTTTADIFDNRVAPENCAEFLNDPRHHLAIALVDGEIVGMASGVHYIHPDKRPEMFINEAGVDPARQGKGIGRKLIAKLCDHAKYLACASAWVLTEPGNTAANKAYAAAGGNRDEESYVMYEFDLGQEYFDTKHTKDTKRK